MSDPSTDIGLELNSFLSRSTPSNAVYTDTARACKWTYTA